MPSTPRRSTRATRKIEASPLKPLSKGTSRTPTGCYTCRLRREKCDERKSAAESNSCETCFRLKIECLGYGTKRPDWLKEASTVALVRDRIKDHLSMEGHSRRNSEQHFLRLSDPNDNATVNAPVESVGHGQNYQSLSHLLDYYDGPSETPALNHVAGPSGKLVLSYQPSFTIDADFEEGIAAWHRAYERSIIESPTKPRQAENFKASPANLWTYPAKLFDDIYKNNFGDHNSTLFSMVQHAAWGHDLSREVIDLLSITRKMNEPHHPSGSDGDELAKCCETVVTRLKAVSNIKAEDAIVALLVLSVLIYQDPRQAKFFDLLLFPCMYAVGILVNGPDCADALKFANFRDAFVIKTVIWFDIISSIHVQTPPLLQHYIQQLFKPNRTTSWVSSCSMLEPIGCENVVVWVLAETSLLACWKTEQRNLKVRELIQRISRLESYLKPGRSGATQHASPVEKFRFQCSEVFRTSTNLLLKTVEVTEFAAPPVVKRYAEETATCIEAMFNLIGDLGKNTGLVSSTVERVIFPIYLCISLAEEAVVSQLELLLKRYSSDERVDVGVRRTASKTWKVLQWGKERLSQGQPVDWRSLLARHKISFV